MTLVFVLAPTPMIQAGLRTMLTSDDIQVIGESAIPTDVIAELPAIDVVVADEQLLAEVERVVKNASTVTETVALVVLSSDIERSVPLLRALSLRSWSIVPVNATAAQLRAAVTATDQGFVALPTDYSNQLYARRPAIPTTTPVSLGTLDENLTAREREVLELVSQGLSNKLIARRLQISEHTVKFHISSITTKLGAASRTDAVSRGVRLGLITL